MAVAQWLLAMAKRTEQSNLSQRSFGNESGRRRKLQLLHSTAKQNLAKANQAKLYEVRQTRVTANEFRTKVRQGKAFPKEYQT